MALLKRFLREHLRLDTDDCHITTASLADRKNYDDVGSACT